MPPWGSEMIRNGLYAAYGGRQFKAARTADGKIKLLADVDPPQGFEKTPYGNYIKIVEPGAVDDLEIIKTYAEMDGVAFEVESERDGQYTIAAPDAEIARKMGFAQAGRGDYRKRVPAESVDRVYEQKRPAGQ